MNANIFYFNFPPSRKLRTGKQFFTQMKGGQLQKVVLASLAVNFAFVAVKLNAKSAMFLRKGRKGIGSLLGMHILKLRFLTSRLLVFLFMRLLRHSCLIPRKDAVI